MNGVKLFCGVHSGGGTGHVIFTPFSVIYNATSFSVETVD